MRKPFLFGLFLLLLVPAMAQEENTAKVSSLYIPKEKSELPNEVKETSGVFFHNGLLWTHNDSGGKPILYALDTVTFQVVQRITLTNGKNKDWEDVCTDGKTVFVGDMGNNKGKRNHLRIYTFPFSAIPEKGDASVTVDSIVFRFADQTNFEKRKEHDFDCEAMFATEHHLYLLSKGWATATTRLYRLPKTPGEHVAEVVNSFDSKGLVTGADYDPKNNMLAIVGYVKKGFTPFVYLVFDFDEHSKNLAKHRFELQNVEGMQTEGICFYDKGRCFVTAEVGKLPSARVFELDFRKWMEQYDKDKAQ